jgi:hypothetical protein
VQKKLNCRLESYPWWGAPKMRDGRKLPGLLPEKSNPMAGAFDFYSCLARMMKSAFEKYSAIMQKAEIF